MNAARCLIALALVCALQACAIYPTEPESRVAETMWLTLDAIDTAQTAHFVQQPACYYESDRVAAAVYGGRNPPSGRVVAVNAVLAVVHPMISRWFDDHAQEAYERDDDTATLWAVGRIAWHGASLLATGASVADNYSRGISPFEARCSH